MAQDDKFDVMADLCILAGQAVMQVGSGELRAAMRVVLGILGQEVAARTVAERAAEAPAKQAAKRSRRGGLTAAAQPARLAPCA